MAGRTRKAAGLRGYESLRRNRAWRIVEYAVIGLAIIAAFIISAKLTNKKEEDVTIASFKILRENEEISALYYDGEYVWVGSKEGVFLYDPDTLEIKNEIKGIEMVYAAGIERTPDGSMWIGHEDGLTRIGTDGERQDFAKPQIPKGRVNTVRWDGESLWMGTYNGAARLIPDEGTWKVKETANQKTGLISDSVMTILPAGDALWFGSYLDTKTGGITIVLKDTARSSPLKGKMQTLSVKDGLPHPYITSLLALDEETVLAGGGYGSEGGLALIQKKGAAYKVVSTYDADDGLPGNKVRFLYRDADGYLWITTESDGILVTDLQTEKNLYYTKRHGLSDDEIKCITETDAYYWLGGKYGLTIIPKDYIRQEMGRCGHGQKQEG